MAINFNNQNRGIGTLDLSQFGLMQPQNTNMQVADAYNTPTEGEYGFNLIQLDRLKNAGYDPAELSTYPNQEDVQSIIRNLEPTANANNIMTDANVGTPSSIIQDEQGNLIDTENRVQFGNENFDSEPYQYTPNYLGANSPMLDVEGDEYGYKFTYNNDPAFGKLKSYLSGSTGYPQNQTTLRSEYFDRGEQVPSLQRALGNERFAMAPEQPDFINAPQDFYQQYSQPKELGFIEPAAVPKEAIYQDRIMNNNLSNSNYEPKQGILQGLQDKIGGLRDFLPFGDKSLSGMAVKGIKGLFEKLGNGADYQQYDPNVDYSKFNPNMEINDFYDPRTKTNRFQRATPGSFASFRTGADYFKARREKKEAKLQEKIKQDNIKAAAEAAARERARAKSITAGYGGGNDNDRPSTGPTSVGAGMGVGGGYASDYGFLKDGGSVGLASMFTRRR